MEVGNVLIGSGLFYYKLRQSAKKEVYKPVIWIWFAGSRQKKALLVEWIAINDLFQEAEFAKTKKGMQKKDVTANAKLQF